MSEIPNGLRADIMRKRMLDKNTLSSAGSLLSRDEAIKLNSKSITILGQILDEVVYYLFYQPYFGGYYLDWAYQVDRVQKANNAIGILSDQWHSVSNPYVLNFDKYSTLILRTQYQETTYETIIDWGELATTDADIHYITYLTGYGYCYLEFDISDHSDTPYSIAIPVSLRTNLSIVGYKILY